MRGLIRGVIVIGVIGYLASSAIASHNEYLKRLDKVHQCMKKNEKKVLTFAKVSGYSKNSAYLILDNMCDHEVGRK